MKKNFVRIVAALLVAMLALTLIPMGALAATIDVWVDKNVYDERNPELDDQINYLGTNIYTDGDKIKVKDYDKLYTDANGDLYDFRGFATTEKFQKKATEIWNNTAMTDSEKQEAINKIAHDYELSFSKKDVKIDRFPINGSAEAQNKWFNKWSWVIAGYTPHQHSLTCWISDGTTHWKNCTVCREKFIYQNWCQDGDEDGICNVCGGDVPYHDVTVIETEGGKITVNKDTASHRTKITADVETADGYKLKQLHFIKVRDDGSEQEITRYKKDGQFWTRMPTYELKVTAEFVKK